MIDDPAPRPAAGREPGTVGLRHTGMRRLVLKALPAAVLAAVLGAVLTGCGSQGAAPGQAPASDPAGSFSASTAPTPAPTPTPTPSTLPEATDPPIIGPGRVTLTGVVHQGAEPGCWILQTASGKFDLLSLDPTPTDGQTLRVSGHLLKVMSHCMEGRPFAVDRLDAR
jgi:hypothetical protein